MTPIVSDRHHPLRTWALLAFVAISLAGGCASHRGTNEFMKSVNAIETGTPMEKVQSRLGNPDEKREGEGPVRPVPPVGSPESVLVTVPAKMKYRQWVYRRGESNFHVFFVPTVSVPGKWEVLAVRSAPASKA